jgi:hypothetical protein
MILPLAPALRPTATPVLLASSEQKPRDFVKTKACRPEADPFGDNGMRINGGLKSTGAI